MHREFEIFRDVFARFFQPVISAVTTSSGAKGLLFDLGYVPPQQFKVFENFKARIDAVEDAIASMAELSEEEIEANPQLIITNAKNGAQAISALANDLRNISAVLETELLGSELLQQTDIIEALPGKLFDYLTIEYLRQYHYKTYSALNLFGIIEINAIRTVANPCQSQCLERIFHWDRIGELITSPVQLLKTTLKDEDQYFYKKSLQLIQEMGLSIGLIPHYKFPVPDVLRFISNDPLIEDWPGFSTLEILRFPLIPGDFDSLGVDVYPIVNRVANKIKGLVLVLGFDPDKKEFVLSDKLKLSLELSGSIANGLGVVIDENDQFRFVTDLFGSPQDLLHNVQFGFRARIRKNDAVVEEEEQKLLQIGTTNGNRLEIGSFNLAFGIEKKQNTRIYFETELLQGLIVLKFNGADGFISKVVGEGIESKFDLGIGFSNSNGFYFLGSGTLSIQLPMHLNLGSVEISALTFSVGIQGKTFPTYVAANIKAILGPIEAVVEDVGMQVDIVFKDDRDGNLGPIDLQLVFKPPSGVGLVIDAAGVSGGGFLSLDQQSGLYTGAVQLNLEGGLALRALGMIATRLPDGSKGFSLLVVITAENFKPYPLGLGFWLTGIGGLLAINRTFNEQVLREGIKNHTLDSVLFPANPTRDALQLLSNLNKVFPMAPGHHLLGPMAEIEWGTPTLLTMQLGIVLEIGARLRLLVLGQVEAILPKKENDLLRIKMDAVGILDFDQGTVSLDAVLYESRLLKKFVLTGAMALRLKWKGAPSFALAIGGLHHAFNPPANFPRLDRIAINLSAGDNPRITCEAYFAVTSNTVQFGARANLYAAAHGFSIEGDIGFDVLIQLNPFHFLAEFHASIQLKRGSRNLFMVAVEGALEGPRPLRARGKATFEILWWDVSVSFDKTLVEGDRPPPPPAINVLNELTQALSDRRNWQEALPVGERRVVTVRELPAPDEVRIHPLGKVGVKQTVVPLNLTRDIDKFGSTAPSGPRRFSVTSVTVGGLAQKSAPLTDFFAPGQFFEMTDDEKIASPSFDTMEAGIMVGADNFMFSSSDGLSVVLTYKTILVDTQTSTPGTRKDDYRLNPDRLFEHARFGAAGRSDVRRTGTAKFQNRQRAPQVAVTKPGFVIASAEDLSPQAVPGVEAGKAMNFTDAQEALRKLSQKNPAEAKKRQVVRAYELIRS
jgi:hypothetical protein